MRLRSDRSPSPTRRITSSVSAATVSRRSSILLASKIDYPDRPTVVVLTVGGRSDMREALLKYWEDEAHEEEFNFCAIEAGDAAEPDRFLTELLYKYVPLDTPIYILQRDAKVPSEEVKRVQDLLNRLEISVATNAPLLANEYGAPIALPVEREEPEDAELEHADTLLGNQTVMSDHRHPPFEADVDFLGQRPSMPSSVVSAFNVLQFTSHWQASTSSHGAKVLCELLDRISIEKAVQRHVQSPLESMFIAMAGDRAMLEAVLSVVAHLPANSDSLVAVSRMYLGYMEQRVASGNLDNEPLV